MSVNRNRRRAGKHMPGDEIFERLDIVQPNAAGIDIGSETHYVAVPEDRDEQPVQTFGCYTPDLERMAAWLKKCRITSVAMESTGVYWVSAYQILSRHGFDVQLVDAHHARNVPGRKTDVWDCRWIRKLHTFGLLRGCFIPPADVQEIRTYWRHRSTLVESCSQQANRIQKALEQMNLHLHKALSDVMGVSGLRIIRAIMAGERDTTKLADMCDRRVKASKETIIKALTGNYRADHLFTLKQALETYDFLHQQMQECDEQLKECMACFQDKNPGGNSPVLPSERKPVYRKKNEPYIDMRDELERILGADITKIEGISSLTAMVVLSECGPDLSAFPSERHFASWLGLCPNHRITGGKIRKNGTRKVVNRLATALRVAAQSLHHNQSAIGAYLRKMAARHGMPKAITATAHKLARLIYNLITHGHEYHTQSQAQFEQKHRERQLCYLQTQARIHGYSLIIASTGEVVS
jgi:transposase